MRTFDLELLKELLRPAGISTDTLPVMDDALCIVPVDDACSGFDLVVTYFDTDDGGRLRVVKGLPVVMTRRLPLIELVVGEPR